MTSGFHKRFRSVSEVHPNQQWEHFYQASKSHYIQWFLKEGEFNRPSYRECARALETYMPELVPMWKHLVTLSGGGDLNARMLSLYCHTPFASGCSQAVWTRYQPILVRNYDYDINKCEGLILKSRWHDTEVIGSTDCLWGILDGMNAHGLAGSLSFGGRDEIGAGFAISLILRYVMEFCKTTEEAIAALCRIPSHMAYNVTLLDANSHVATVEISPMGPPEITNHPVAVNHQGKFELTEYTKFCRSYEREQVLYDRLYDPSITLESFVNGFEYSPLRVTEYGQGLGTLYTAVYNPSLRAMEYRWPNHKRLYQSFNAFDEGEVDVRY